MHFKPAKIPSETAKSVETAVNPKQLSGLLRLMYAAVSTIVTEQKNKALALQVAAWASAAKTIDRELGTNLVSSLVDIVRTGQADEDELIGPARDFRRAVGQVLRADTAVDHTELEMMKALSTYLISRSDTALRNAVKLLPVLGEPDLTQSFIFDPKSQRDFLKPLEKIVYAATKEKGRTILTADEGKRLKAKAPQTYKEYLRLRKDYNQVWKDELRNLVFESKKKAVKFQAAVDYLELQGIKHNLPQGFEGLIDANGQLYTTAGKAIAGVPGVGFSIRMNPEYNAAEDNSYVFTTVNDTTGKVSQHVYTIAYKKQATTKKFEKVQNLDKVIDGVRKKWLTHMKRGGKEPQVVASTLLELLYQFSARIGSMGNVAGGTPTFGMSTLLVKHFKEQGNTIVISYSGKDGVRQVHKLAASTPEGKILMRNVKILLIGKGPKDRVFTFEGPSTGRVLPMTGNLVNRWFQKLGSPVTVHKLRHVRGTRLFNELLAANSEKIFTPKTPLTEAQALKMFNQLASKVGQMLGHVRGVGAQQKVTPMTAIQNYISPVDMVQYFQRLGFRTPKFLSKFKE